MDRRGADVGLSLLLLAKTVANWAGEKKKLASADLVIQQLVEILWSSHRLCLTCSMRFVR